MLPRPATVNKFELRTHQRAALVLLKPLEIIFSVHAVKSQGQMSHFSQRSGTLSTQLDIHHWISIDVSVTTYLIFCEASQSQAVQHHVIKPLNQGASEARHMSIITPYLFFDPSFDTRITHN